MLRVIRENIQGIKYPIHAALALSFASFGDAFLYPFLPQYAEIMRVPVVWIGILLSINRFIRIFFNPVVVRLFHRFGVREVTVVASVMAIVSTFGYGLGLGLISLIIFRLIWGMAFAILRLSALAYALEQPYAGPSLGIGKAIQDAGPLVSLWLGPLLLDHFSILHTFYFLSLFSFPSLAYAYSLPRLNYFNNPGKIFRDFVPTLVNASTFVVSFLAEGLLIIVIGIFLQEKNFSLTSWEVTAMAAGYLAYRRLCSFFFGPLSGFFATKVGFTAIYNFSVLSIITGVIFLLIGWVSAGLVIIFTFNSVGATVAPQNASANEPDKIRAVAVNATWRDMGAATGTLTGGLLLGGSFLSETFSIATFILAVLLFFQFLKK